MAIITARLNNGIAVVGADAGAVGNKGSRLEVFGNFRASIR